MDFLNLKRNKYFFNLVENHAKSFNIKEREFQENLLVYLKGYSKAHWFIIEDYLLEPQVSKVNDFNKSFKDYQFCKNYLWNFYGGFFKQELQEDLEKISSNIVDFSENVQVLGDFYVLDNGDKIPRKDPISILKDIFNIKEKNLYLVLMLSYDKEFITKIRNTYIKKEKFDKK